MIGETLSDTVRNATKLNRSGVVKWFGCVCAAALVSLPAYGQKWKAFDGTNTFGFEETREGGALAGCNLSFQQVAADDIYRRGAPVVVSGIITLIQNGPSGFGFFLKIKGADVQVQGGYEPSRGRRPFTLHEFSPSFAYAEIVGFSTAHKEIRGGALCEGLGYCAVFNGPANFGGFLEMVTGPVFRVGLQRRAGGTDLVVNVKISTEREMSPAGDQFLACAQQVIKGLR